MRCREASVHGEIEFTWTLYEDFPNADVLIIFFFLLALVQISTITVHCSNVYLFGVQESGSTILGSSESINALVNDPELCLNCDWHTRLAEEVHNWL